MPYQGEKMAAIKVSIYALKNGKFQVSYQDRNTHKRVRRKFKTLKEAKEFEIKLKSKINKGEALEALKGRSFKLETLVQLHFEECPKTKFKERYNVYLSFMNAFSQRDIFEVKTKDIIQWFEYIRELNSYTERTLSHIKAQLNHFFKFLVHEEIIEHNPLDSIKFRQNLPPKRSKIILSPEDIEMILEHIKEISPSTFFPYFYALVHTGSRRREMADLKWEDVNLKSHILTFKNTKNGTNRTIKLPRKLNELLSSLNQESHFVFKGTKGAENITNAQIYRFFQRFRKRFPNYPKFACHDLRHSFAFNFLKKGGNMYALKAILGHKSIQMTIDLYGNFKSIDVENPSPYDF